MIVYPTLDEVNAADRMTLARWYRFLVSPNTPEETAVLNSILGRFKEAGGMNSQLSKAIGWDRS